MKPEILSREDIDYEVAKHSLDGIINYNEVVVLDVMRDVYKNDPGLCHCSLCVEDVFALSLNRIPPRYIQPTNIEVYIKSGGYIDYNEIKRYVMTAVSMVREKPGH